MRETTDSLRQVFTGAKRPGLVAPFQPALHPILIHFAALALETVQLAGELANGMMLHLATLARYRQMVTRMADAAVTWTFLRPRASRDSYSDGIAGTRLAPIQTTDLWPGITKP